MIIRKTTSILLVLAIFGLTSTGSLLAQTSQTKQEKQADKVKTKIRQLGTGERVKVKVKLYSGTRYEGHIGQAGDADFVVVDKTGSAHTVNYADVKSIGGRNLSTGAKIAIGVGIGAGATLLVLYLVFVHITENN